MAPKRSFINPVLFFAGSAQKAIWWTWTAFVVAYVVAPVSYVDAPVAGTWGFLLASVTLFSLSVWSASGKPSVPQRVVKKHVPDARAIDKLVRTCALVGIFGLFCVLLDKLVFSGLDFSAGTTALRYQRALAEVEATGSQRSYLAALAILTFLSGAVALLLQVLEAERVRRSTTFLVILSACAPIAFSVTNGGRSAILVTTILGLAGMTVRKVRGQTFLPRGVATKWLLLFFLAGTVVYSIYIFAERRRFANGDAPQYSTIQGTRSYSVAPWLATSVYENTIGIETGNNIVNTSYYFTHSAMVLQRTLAYRDHLSYYWGQFQFSLLSLGFDRVFPRFSMTSEMTRELTAANSYGGFVTAWGSMLLEFGYLGWALQIFLWGRFCGKAFARISDRNDLTGALYAAFALSLMWLSPIHSIVGMCHAYMIIIQMILIDLFLRKRALQFAGSPGSASSVGSSFRGAVLPGRVRALTLR